MLVRMLGWGVTFGWFKEGVFLAFAGDMVPLAKGTASLWYDGAGVTMSCWNHKSHQRLSRSLGSFGFKVPPHRDPSDVAAPTWACLSCAAAITHLRCLRLAITAASSVLEVELKCRSSAEFMREEKTRFFCRITTLNRNAVVLQLCLIDNAKKNAWVWCRSVMKTRLLSHTHTLLPLFLPLSRASITHPLIECPGVAISANKEPLVRRQILLTYKGELSACQPNIM